MPKLRLLLATTNKGKLAELRSRLQQPDLELLDLSQVPDSPEPAETEDTFAGNALLKARYYSERTGLAALADDSGLMIEVLNGRPGVHSARLADSDAGRIAAVLKLIDEVDEVDEVDEIDEVGRDAAFVCAVAVCRPDGSTLQVEGRVEGRILRRPRGDGGFGYDPIFYYPPADRTFAEMSRAEKNRISHRAAALQELAPRLETFLRS